MDWLQKWFAENIGLKLLSLLLAVALWAALGGDTETEALFRVPLEFRNVPAGLEVLRGQTTVTLLARGLSQALQQASPSDFGVRVDLSSVPGPGVRAFPLAPQDAEVPASLEVVQMVPSEVRLTLEQTLSKEVPIQLSFFGELAPGHRVKNYQLRPSHVKIAGPSSRVAPIAFVSTDPIDLTALSRKGTFVTTAYTSDPLIRFESTPTVEVTAELETPAPKASSEAGETAR